MPHSFDEVLDQELQYILARRKEAKLDTSSTLPNGTIGLALSGGGIRSAAFNLGFLQGLGAHYLKWIDYLSTVSGGGFIGATLSNLLRENPSDWTQQGTFDDAPYSPLVSYLHENCHYLGARGFLPRLGAMLLRGILYNFALLLPLVFAIAFLISGLYKLTHYLNFFWILTTSTTLVWLISLLFFETIYLVLKALWRTSPKISTFRPIRDRTIGFLLVLIPVALLLDMSNLVLPAYHNNEALNTWGIPLWLCVIVGALLVTLPILILAVSGMRVPAAVYSLLGSLLLYLPSLAIGEWIVFHFSWKVEPLSLWILSFWVFLSVYLIFFFLVDVNESSMHGFYRDGLAKTFIVDRKEPGSFGPAENVRLSDICKIGSRAPYHLFNTALNLQANIGDRVRGRTSDFFLLSPYFVGSHRTGYCPTPHMEKVYPNLDLPAAVAISGAAVSALRGKYTYGPHVLPMTLLNLRLGTWIPNPKKLSDKDERLRLLMRLVRWISWRPRAQFLLREMFSAVHERGQGVYLSDGGHLDNTGAWELLRRRCSLIIVSDAEEDRPRSCRGLMDLIRYAGIDLGIRIDIDLGDLQREIDEVKFDRRISRDHLAVGRIHYPDRRLGYLIYVKASLTGDEGPIVTGYAIDHKQFPHESTADQFYDEERFEAYRELGSHVAWRLKKDSLSPLGENLCKVLNEICEMNTE